MLDFINKRALRLRTAHLAPLCTRFYQPDQGASPVRALAYADEALIMMCWSCMPFVDTQTVG